MLTVSIGKSLRTKLKGAVKNAIKHNNKHDKLTAAREPATVVIWNGQIENWLGNPFDNPNPFFDPPASKCTFKRTRILY